MTLRMADQETRADVGPDATDQNKRPICSIGVMAHNEEANIRRCLVSLLKQRTERARILEIVVVVSGSTDGTAAAVKEFGRQDPRVKLFNQPKREGKASAVNLFLARTDSPILVLVGADNILAPDSIEHLVQPFADPEVGMTGGHPIPVNGKDGFMGFSVHLMWDLHHQIALKKPKLGELTAFRRVFERIPPNTEVDEAKIEPLVYGQGYQLRYVPEAIVFNRGPGTVREFLKQRRRINAGHIRLRQRYGYSVSTLNGLLILATLARHPHFNLKWLFWTPAVAVLEVYARLLGWWDARWARRDHHIWEMVVSTKEL